MGKYSDLCQQRGIRIIEDAAEGIGATYEGNKAGTFGEVSLFSFNATKLIMSDKVEYFAQMTKSSTKKRNFSHTMESTRLSLANTIGRMYLGTTTTGQTFKQH